MKVNPADALSDLETAFDYVVCVMDSRIGDILGYPGYRTYDNTWNDGDYWQHMGYPSDLSGGSVLHFRIMQLFQACKLRLLQVKMAMSWDILTML